MTWTSGVQQDAQSRLSFSAVQIVACVRGTKVGSVGNLGSPPLTSRESSLSDAWFAQSSRITRVSFFLNSVFSTDISTDLRLPSGTRAVFVNASDLGTKTSGFEARFPSNLGYFVVSHVALNLNKTEALLYVDHFCGGLCGGGEYVLMRKVNGVWHVVDHHGAWVS